MEAPVLPSGTISLGLSGPDAPSSRWKLLDRSDHHSSGARGRTGHLARLPPADRSQRICDQLLVRPEWEQYRRTRKGGISLILLNNSTIEGWGRVRRKISRSFPSAVANDVA